MKIRKIVLYGFGQHEDVEINVQAGMNILYGPNEAGKTTIQQAILHILFGFPQKNQQELRYEPKTGGKYGGCLYIDDKEFGPWMIERVRGKSSGDVTVHFGDGRKTGEDELKRLLRGYDRAAFEAIFSFSLFQLQGLERMDETDISRTLLASGTTGLDTLWKVEKKMDKEMAALFKKAGRNPPMNQKLKELKELELAMQKEQQKLATFEPLSIRKQQVDERVKALRREEQQLHEQAEEHRVAMQVMPLQQQQKQVTEQLAALPSESFPADGIRRYEELASKQSELQSKRMRIVKEQQLTAETIVMRPDNEQRQIERWVAQEAEWHRLRGDVLSAEQEIRALEKKQQQSKQRLGLTDAQQQAIEEMDLSIQRERQLEPLLQEQTTAEQQLQALNRMLAEAESERQEAEERKILLAHQQPTDAERQQLAKLPELKRQLDEAKARVSVAKQSTNRAIPVFFMVMGLLIGAYGVWQQDWFIVTVSLITIVAGILLWKKQPDSMEDLHDFIDKHEVHVEEMKRLKEQVAEHQRQCQQLEAEIDRLDRKLQKLAAEMEQVHHQMQQAGIALQQAVQGDPIDSTSNLQENFRLLREYQDILAEQRTWKLRLANGKQQIRTWVDQVEMLLGPISEDTLYEQLRQELMKQKASKEKDHNRKQLLKDLDSQLNEVDTLLATVQREIEELFRLPDVSDKEQFYAAYQTDQEAQLLKRQLTEVNSQLALYSKKPLTFDWTLPELERQRTETTERLQIIRKEVTALVDEQVKMDHKLTEMGASQTYSELQQLFEVKKAELEELAKQWVVRKAVMESIRQTMSGWKEHQLPAVLTLANTWFSCLTGNRYRTLTLTAEGYFQAVTASGQSFMINELSQATKEQAYLSLRLALASELSNRAPFPVIMDDPFVHFDNERLSRMIEIIKELQPSHQFLYFTCHADMQLKWSGETSVIEIGKQ
ncbi:hypothetical protein CSV79_13565 [Sporosarcina sp. P13]|uniref:AAA family ATPase n=1 Tax=Sporosarcina sp. P13 TaxID=2048263 RepID=UPI000C16E8D7|nr:AAA family ATPase [Sporosarcina sp. P13]PIC63112.1 hypothetical protein CSV79_13565 [Sporosarcina sp. P13]